MDEKSYRVHKKQLDTREHISKVQVILGSFTNILKIRSKVHDESKLKEPELSLFFKWSPMLSKMEYGSDEYKAALINMGPALKHHYKNNRHHPEYFPEGIIEMNLFDLLEMLADWKASTERVKDGDIANSLRVNAKRFHMSEDIAGVLANTVRDLGWVEK